LRTIVGIDIIGEDPDRDRDLDRANLRRSDDVPEAKIERGTETRDVIESGGVVHGIETEKGVIEGNVPRGTEIAKENGTLLKRVSVS